MLDRSTGREVKEPGVKSRPYGNDGDDEGETKYEMRRDAKTIRRRTEGADETTSEPKLT